MWPLVPVYGAVTRLRRELSGWGLTRRHWLEAPVISIGSCSAGGAGKTPVVLLLAQSLARRGYEVRVLTRGYGRLSNGVERVNPEGDAAWYGDEPMLLARRSGAPVFVGANRYEAGLLAENDVDENRIAVHLLDDGFQHWRLGRDIDVVLLTREDMEDTLLPAGNLRESLAALRDADVIVLREEELASTEGLVESLRRGERAPLVWVVRRGLTLLQDGGTRDTAARKVERPVAFCGIARPEGFAAMLAACGVVAATSVVFADHHPYADADMSRLIEAATESGADGFVTTEKDAVKLTDAMRARLETIGLVITARLELELLDERAAMDRMIARVRAMERRRGRKVWR
nr:tetraacyldisaccharide 4'-kinase [Granulicella sp. dw_53]